MDAQHRFIRIFLSSPGDVAEERKIAREVINDLAFDTQLRNKVVVRPVAWDDLNSRTPMIAMLPPQEAINRGLPKPSECDILVVIFWSRMGTPLLFPEYKKPDGSQYLSGTEWEYLDAVTGAEEHPYQLPIVVVYRRELTTDDPEFEERRKHEQYQRVENFFAQFVHLDGAFRGGYNEYKTPGEFNDLFKVDVKQLIAAVQKTPLDEAQQRKRAKDRDFLPTEVELLAEKLNDPTLDHATRAKIGEQLHVIGDSRPGVGLRPDGFPDIVWCLVSGGSVTFDNDEHYRGLDVIVHPFYIAKYPITVIQFQAFLDDPDGFSQDKWWDGLARSNIPRAISVMALERVKWWEGLEDRPPGPGEPRFKFSNHPRETVSWYDAMGFCRWLTAKLPAEAWPAPLAQPLEAVSMPLRWDIRLPTEWEWQQAATGGNPANKYPWGTEWNSSGVNSEESGLGRTIAVGMYPEGVSPCGALDMAGNVWEWCFNTYYSLVDAVVYGSEAYGMRGGSWRYDKDSAGTMYRSGFNAHVRDHDIGFRVVASWTL
jgi:formylglycine-generating enzyme required for sulfatase activity